MEGGKMENVLNINSYDNNTPKTNILYFTWHCNVLGEKRSTIEGCISKIEAFPYNVSRLWV